MQATACYLPALFLLTALTTPSQAQTVVGAWGDNEVGEITVPAGLTDVVTIATGGYHTIALKSNGTLVAWGVN